MQSVYYGGEVRTRLEYRQNLGVEVALIVRVAGGVAGGVAFFWLFRHLARWLAHWLARLLARLLARWHTIATLEYFAESGPLG